MAMNIDYKIVYTIVYYIIPVVLLYYYIVYYIAQSNILYYCIKFTIVKRWVGKVIEKFQILPENKSQASK